MDSMKKPIAIFAAIVAALAVAVFFGYRSLSQPPPLILVYERKGGIAGLSEELLVYGDGLVVYRRPGLESRAHLPPEVVRAFELLLESLEKAGFSEVDAKPGAADFFSHEVSYSPAGTKFRWVDEWASERPLPAEVTALGTLLDYAISYALGEVWENSASHVAGELRIEAHLNRVAVGRGSEASIRAFVSNLGKRNLTYDLPTPCDPDIEIRVEPRCCSVRYTQPSIDPDAVCPQVVVQRSLGPGETRVNAATIEVEEDAEPGLYWFRVSFPYGNSMVEVSLPIVVVKG